MTDFGIMAPAAAEGFTYGNNTRISIAIDGTPNRPLVGITRSALVATPKQQFAAQSFQEMHARKEVIENLVFEEKIHDGRKAPTLDYEAARYEGGGGGVGGL
jgi:hypothetical protein